MRVARIEAMRTWLWLAALLAVTSSASAKRGERARPLANSNVLWLPDLHRSNDVASKALRSAGLRPHATIAVGLGAYGGRTASSDALMAQGFDVHLPAMSRFAEAVDRALEQVVMRHKQNGRRIVVVEQGSLVARLLRAKKYDGVRGAFHFVFHPADRRPQSGTARVSERSQAIGLAVARKVVGTLARRERPPRSMRVLVLGNTPRGQASAMELVRMGVDVTLVDPAASRAHIVAARRKGLRLINGRGGPPPADVVVDATAGEITRRDLPRGAVVVSAAEIAETAIPGERDMRKVREIFRESFLEAAKK